MKQMALVALALASNCQAFTSPAAPLATTRSSSPSFTTTLQQRKPAASFLQMTDNQEETIAKNKNNNPTPALVSLFQEHVPSPSRNSLVAAAAMSMALAFSPLASDAAMSGGRMGGASFQSRPSMSRSMPGPSRGGYYGGGRGYYGGGPMIAPVPMITPFYNPFFSPFGGFGGGLAVPFRGPSLFPLFMFGGMALFVTNALRGFGAVGTGSNTFFRQDERETPSVLGSGTSVIKMSVALDVPNRDDPNSILSTLHRLAETSRTDSRVGIQNLSSQVALEILRRQSSIVSASAECQHYKNRDQAQRNFNSLSVQERGKFEQETLSKYGGVDYSSSGDGSTRAVGGVDGKATMAVVTLVLAIDGDSTKVPRIRSIADVEGALRQIASDVKVSDCLQGAEILWTPEDRSETLSRRDVIADYPELHTVWGDFLILGTKLCMYDIDNKQQNDSEQLAW